MALFERRLLSLVAMLVRDGSGAEEIVQDAFVRAYLHLDRYDEQRALYPWLAKIAVRLAQNWIVRRRRSRIDEGAQQEDHADPRNSDPEHELLLDEAKTRLWHAVAALPQGERMAVVLCYRQGMSVADAARTLGVTNGTVKTWLFRARRKLRGELTRDAVEDFATLEEAT